MVPSPSNVAIAGRTLQPAATGGITLKFGSARCRESGVGQRSQDRNVRWSCRMRRTDVWFTPGLLGIRGCEDDRMPRHASRSLVIWSGVLLVVLAAHDLSHALDGGLETPLDQLALVAVPQWLLLAVVMTVIVRGERARGAAAAL